MRDGMRERRRREWRSDIFGRKVRPRNGMQTPRQHIGAILTPAARSPASRSPSGDEQRYGRNGVALLGIVVQVTACVARLMIIPILTATHSARFAQRFLKDTVLTTGGMTGSSSSLPACPNASSDASFFPDKPQYGHPVLQMKSHPVDPITASSRQTCKAAA